MPVAKSTELDEHELDLDQGASHED